jgi:replication factor C small subunit
MTDINAPLLSDQLRPQTLTDLALSEDLKRMLTGFVSTGTMMNLLFYGSPGIGKTSAARILLRELEADVLELNGSFNDGDKTMVKKIEMFSHSVSFEGRPRVCFIDEADFMPRTVQDPLRYIIEKTSGNCRFLLTANDPNRLTAAIKSRCAPISFDVSVKDRKTIIDQMVDRYEVRLQDCGVDLDRKRIYEIVSVYFPDLRSIANRFQMESVAMR